MFSLHNADLHCMSIAMRYGIAKGWKNNIADWNEADMLRLVNIINILHKRKGSRLICTMPVEGIRA